MNGRMMTVACAAASTVVCVTGSVVAHAEPVNWPAVAQCESGGNWSADSGNGAYGGLQIKPSTWQANGGVGLPSQATEQQQIAVANRILADQGPGAWPTCMSRGLGGGGIGGGGAPVGSLTQLLGTLIADAEGAAGSGG